MFARPMPARHLQAWLQANNPAVQREGFADSDFQADIGAVAPVRKRSPGADRAL